LIIYSTEPSIDYWLETRENFSIGLQEISIYCKNSGESVGDFNLRIEFTNVVFSNQTKMPYELVNDAIVKIRFSLDKNESQQKKIYFKIPDNIKSFKINLKCEKLSLFLKSNPKFSTELIYSWFEEKFVFMRNIPF
jgi:hypothetical protein